MTIIKIDLRNKAPGQKNLSYLADKVHEAALCSLEQNGATVRLSGNLNSEDLDRLKALVGLYPTIEKEVRPGFYKMKLDFKVKFVLSDPC